MHTDYEYKFELVPSGRVTCARFQRTEPYPSQVSYRALSHNKTDIFIVIYCLSFTEAHQKLHRSAFAPQCSGSISSLTFNISQTCVCCKRSISVSLPADSDPQRNVCKKFTLRICYDNHDLPPLTNTRKSQKEQR